jgi:EAL domain-containing protein (putative c-di-GMP-specific phosphodiesterase class I)/GGDEF domain-containing protein
MECPASQPDGGDAPGLAHKLDRFVRDGRFDVAYQPIVDLQHGEVAAYEALCRPRPDSGFRNATELFDSAELTGRAWEIEARVRTAAIAAAARWPTGIQLFINCSPAVFADTRFARSVSEAVRATENLSTGRIVFEITERAGHAFEQGMAGSVRALRDIGFQVAIDDVGAGASGLNRIMSFRPDWLKLDRALIDGIHEDRVKQNLVRFFAHYSRLSGARVIAEGIETRQDLATIIDLGVVYGQGYVLAHPTTMIQTLSGDAAETVRQRWSQVQTERLWEPLGNRIGRFARAAIALDAATPASEAAQIVERSPALPGVAVAEQHRFVGWVDREALHDAALAGDGHWPLGSLARRTQAPISPDATVAEALEVAAAREYADLATPLILGQGGQLFGIVPIQELLRAAADLGRGRGVRCSPLTGLPGRVRAEEHVRRLLIRSRSAPSREPHDAAFVDLRGLNRYNKEFGYELGDLRINELADQLRNVVARGDREMFLAHVGDDRFLITGPSRALQDRLAELAARFDSDPGGSTRPRILHLPGVLARIDDPHGLFLAADAARESKARGDPRPSRSRPILYPMTDQAGTREVA